MFDRYSDENLLISDIRYRKPAAFEYLRFRCFSFLCVMLNQLTGSDAEAEDVFNSNIAKLIPAIDNPKFRQQKKVHNFFLHICRNSILEDLRKRKPMMDIEDLEDSDEVSFDEEFESKMDRVLYDKILWPNFKKLSKECRKILMKSFDGASMKALAVTMKTSYDYIRQKKIRCYNRLQKYLEENPDYRKIKREFFDIHKTKI